METIKVKPFEPKPETGASKLEGNSVVAQKQEANSVVGSKPEAIPAKPEINSTSMLKPVVVMTNDKLFFLYQWGFSNLRIRIPL